MRLSLLWNFKFSELFYLIQTPILVQITEVCHLLGKALDNAHSGRTVVKYRLWQHVQNYMGWMVAIAI